MSVIQFEHWKKTTQIKAVSKLWYTLYVHNNSFVILQIPTKKEREPNYEPVNKSWGKTKTFNYRKNGDNIPASKKKIKNTKTSNLRPLERCGWWIDQRQTQQRIDLTAIK